MGDYGRFATVDELVFTEGSGPLERYPGGFADQCFNAVARADIQIFLGRIATTTLRCISGDGLQGAVHWVVAARQLRMLRIAIPTGAKIRDLELALRGLQLQSPRTLQQLEIQLERTFSTQELDSLVQILANLCLALPSLTTLIAPLDALEVAGGPRVVPTRVHGLQTLIATRRLSTGILQRSTVCSLHLPLLRTLHISAPFDLSASVAATLPCIEELAITCDSPNGIEESLHRISIACQRLISVYLNVGGSLQQRYNVNWRPLLHCWKMERFQIIYPYTLPFIRTDLEEMLSRWQYINRLSLNPSPRDASQQPALPLSSLAAVAESAPKLLHLEAFMDCHGTAKLSVPRSWDSLLELQLGSSQGDSADIPSIASSILRIFPNVTLLTEHCSPWVQQLGREVQSRKGMNLGWIHH